MAKDDWYRNTSWTDGIERQFFDRLSRARSQRDQHLVIQALTLAEHRPEVALRLVDIYFKTRKVDFDDVRALVAKAAAQMEMGALNSAVETYKLILEVETAKPGMKTTAYLDYPWLVATARLKSEYHEALRVLEDRRSDVAFPIGRFKWNAARALILSNLGQQHVARESALAALEASQESASEFRHHRRLGLVGGRYEAIFRTLKQITEQGDLLEDLG